MTQANVLLDSINTEAELKALVSQLDVSATGKVTVLYSGNINGTYSGTIIKSMLSSGEDIRVLDNTQASKFLDIYDPANQNLKLVDTLKRIFGDDPYAVGSSANQFLFGISDASGTRITTGAWDTISANFVSETVGEVKTLVADARSDRVFAQTEIPALLANENVTSIEGIPKSEFVGKSVDEIFARVKTASLMDIAYSGLKFDGVSLSGSDDFLYKITDLQKYLIENPGAHNLFDAYLKDLDPARQAELSGMAKTMFADASVDISTGSKVLNKLGLLGGLLGFSLAASEAASAAESGDTEQAKEIMAQWAVDETGSAVGEALGTAVGGIAVAALAALGVTLSAPIAAVIVVGGSFVGGFFGGDGATGLYELLKDKDDNDRADIIDKLKDLLFGKDGSTDLPPDIDGNTLTFIPAFSHTEIVEHAKNDIAWRYALQQLNPFIVPDIDYDQHNTDGSLDLYDPATGQGTLTEQWIDDRARFVVLVAEASQTFIPNIFLSWSYYEDIASNKKIGVPIGTDKYIFGDDKANAVEGGLGKDHLYGGKGDDTLTGYGDNDYLQGDRGNDTYLLQSTGGIDTLLDHSGTNRIQIDGASISGTFNPAIDGGKIYYSADKTYELRPLLDGDWRLSERDPNTGEYKAVANIDNWKDGEFGLSLGAADPVDRVTKNFPNSVAYLSMDGSLATQGLELGGGTKSDSFYGSSYDDIINTGGGTSNFVISAYGGNDKVQGGDSKDFIRTGANGFSTTTSDNDLAYGGAQSDVLLGGYGSDQLWGDADDGAWEVAGADSGERGDWLGGENGDDSLYGSRSSDVEFGGAGEDLVRGGAGDDLLLGDAQYSPASRAIALSYAGATTQAFRWNTATSSMVSVPAGSYALYPIMVASGNAFKWTWSVVGDDFTLTTPAGFISETRLAPNGGSDVLDGGLGNDWMAGQTGDDYLNGGDGDDILYGDDVDGQISTSDQGDDTLLGGAGNDRLFGGGGDDSLTGGPGDDTVYGGSGKDTVYFNRGDGHDTVIDPDKDTQLMFGPGIGPKDIILKLGSLALYLGNGDEVHFEDFDPNDVFGSADLGLIGFADGTQLTLNELLAQGFDLTGTASDDRLTGTNTVDHIKGLAGNDTLLGNDGDDILEGGAGNDTLSGGSGIDTADYGTAKSAVKILLGLAGPQKTYGSGYDKLASIENIGGGDFNDYLAGNKTTNVLTGGLGGDYLLGKAGADRFVYTRIEDSGITQSTRDTIADFRVGQGDKIDLSQIDANGIAVGRKTFDGTILKAFDAIDATGQLVFNAASHTLYGSTDPDDVPEFSILLTGVHNFSAASLILA
ncbi:calcium-binding protein [Methylomagnum ishizawai]|uniref:calcium-binding protein n=1 Tax=Methylomagnum ishizawai TaxID=1760988 RepID=UPI001C7EECAA|nr:hypothetical protein [Methylomagnum ishizawai]